MIEDERGKRKVQGMGRPERGNWQTLQYCGTCARKKICMGLLGFVQYEFCMSVLFGHVAC